MDDNNKSQELEVDNTSVSDGELDKQRDNEVEPIQNTPSVLKSTVVKKANPYTHRGMQIPNNKKLQNKPISIPKKIHSIGGNTRGNNSLLSSVSTLFDGSKGPNNTLGGGLFNSNNDEKKQVKGSGVVKGIWKKLPLKAKLIIIGICAAVLLTIIFIVVLITPLMSLGIIDIEGIGSSGGNISSGTTSEDFTTISDSTSYWWPVGGSSTNIGGVTFASEIPSGIRITSKFGMRKHPITGKMKLHSGVDIVGGSNIIAVTDGEVIYPSNKDKTNCASGTGLSDCGGGYGNYVMIRHGDGNVTLYAHLYENSITVRSGDTVKKGQVIAKMGSSGNSTGTHLHFEVRVNKTRVEPLNYISIDNPRP